MTTVKYKGLIYVVAGLLATGGLLWFEDTTRGPVITAESMAELGAGAAQVQYESWGMLVTNRSYPARSNIWVINEWSLANGVWTNLYVTNTISIRPSAPILDAIRAAIMNAVTFTNYSYGVFGVTDRGVFIGPTNRDSTYDGVKQYEDSRTNFTMRDYYPDPFLLVKTSAWYSTFLTNVSVCVSSNRPWVTTNECAWLYSAMYRLRDMQIYPLKVQAERWKVHYVCNTWSECYAAATVDWNSGDPIAGYVISKADNYSQPGGRIVKFDYGTYGKGLSLYMCRCVYALPPQYPLPARVEWMITACTNFYIQYSPDVIGHLQFHNYGTQVNLHEWKTWYTTALIDGTSTSTVVGAWELPSLSDVPDPAPGENASAGWASTRYEYDNRGVTAILRWQQPACTNAIFDGRY